MSANDAMMLPAGALRSLASALLATALLAPGTAAAEIPGVSGSANFNLRAEDGYVSIADGGSIYSWGFTTGSTMQLPGPTLIVTEGATVTVTLTNGLPAAAGNVSILFPGQEVTTSGGVAGALTSEAEIGGSVTYTFTASNPGTYQYHSGTQTDVQVEMGLVGTLIVRPATLPPGCTAAAYDHPGACYDREYLFVLSEIDLDVHETVEAQMSGAGPVDVGLGPFASEYWLLNGRAGPDTMAAPGTGILPTQPYNCLPQMHPGERLLLRIVGAGRELHPFHTHGNHVRVLAQDGHMLVSETDPNSLAGPYLFTVPSYPGSTVDAVFEWTGKDLGWDIYGHSPSDPLEPNEWAPDHGRPMPVQLPDQSVLAFGGWYSGSPYLGDLGTLPPGEGGLNPNAGFAYMWHSHTERELTNNDIYPGGMMTMLLVVPHGVDIP